MQSGRGEGGVNNLAPIYWLFMMYNSNNRQGTPYPHHMYTVRELYQGANDSDATKGNSGSTASHTTLTGIVTATMNICNNVFYSFLQCYYPLCYLDCVILSLCYFIGLFLQCYFSVYYLDVIPNYTSERS